MKISRVSMLLVALALTGCATAGQRQTELMKTADLTISSSALRVQVRSLADRFSGLMETAGEEALRGETDLNLRRRRLLWLTNGIPAMQQALSQSDPLAALLDGWYLGDQLRYYFEGSEDIPPHILEKADHILDEMETDIRNILDNAGPDTNYERGRRLVYDGAAKNPVDETFATRRGSAAYLSEFTTRAGGNALASIGSATETLDDLVARIDLDAEWVPKLARMAGHADRRRLRPGDLGADSRAPQ